jgi:hypothetical protein
LLEGSHLVDDCPICDRLPIVVPLRGTYDLRFIQQGPLFSYYALENICFTNSGTTNLSYKVTGNGLFQIGGEVGLQQSLFLQVYVNNGFTNRFCYFTNTPGAVTRFWPMMQVNVSETNGTFVQVFDLNLNAAPLREIWFSTSQDFTAGVWNPPTNLVQNGDLISASGRVVKRNEQLTQALGLMPPPPPDLGLKGIDILSGGEIAFSINQLVWSETLGSLTPGDLLSDRGRILRRNQDLVAAFQPQNPPTNGLGLGAVQLMPSGETWFSVQTNFYSGALRTTVSPGDLLSDAGAIIRSNAQLVAAFGPSGPTKDFGLTSVHVWPNGEVWFSTASGFAGTNGTTYNAGDLLSDQGYIVYHNSELLSNFQSQSTNNIPVDALYFVSDILPNSPPPVLGTPQLTNQPPFSLALQWHGAGRTFQLEKSASPVGPYSPAAPITTDTNALDPGAQTNVARTFYRVHQW